MSGPFERLVSPTTDEQAEDRGTARLLWTGDTYARLVWICRECGASGSGEDDEGIAAGIRHRDSCNRLPPRSQCLGCGARLDQPEHTCLRGEK